MMKGKNAWHPIPLKHIADHPRPNTLKILSRFLAKFRKGNRLILSDLVHMSWWDHILFNNFCLLLTPLLCTVVRDSKQIHRQETKQKGKTPWKDKLSMCVILDNLFSFHPHTGNMRHPSVSSKSFLIQKSYHMCLYTTLAQNLHIDLCLTPTLILRHACP